MSHPFSFNKGFQCECCKNPWQKAMQDSIDKNRCLKAKVDSTNPNETKKFDIGSIGIDPDNIDAKVSGKDDFYTWSNGGWMNKNEIPKEYPQWNTFMMLRDQNLDRIKIIVDELVNKKQNNEFLSPDEEKICTAYSCYMNEDLINQSGVQPLLPFVRDIFNQFLASTSKASNVSMSSKEIEKVPSKLVSLLHKHGIKCLFSFHSSPDMKNSNHCIGTVYQGGLGLPDRDYYFDNDKAEKRQKYVAYVANLFHAFALAESQSTTGATPDVPLLFNEYKSIEKCEIAAKQIFDFEKELAGTHLTRTEMRDPDRVYNKFKSISDLTQFTQPEMTKGDYLAHGKSKANFNWLQYFASVFSSTTSIVADSDDEDIVTADKLGYFNVYNPKGLKTVAQLISSPVLPLYMLFHTMDSTANLLPSQFVELKFNFFSKDLQGTLEMKPRWKRALDFIESTLGEALGKIYVAKYFDDKCKAKALKIVENVKNTLSDRLHEVEWMSEETKKEAIKKMKVFGLKIGFPDKWVNYDSFQLLNDDLAAPSAAASAVAAHVNSKLIQNYFILTNFELSLDVCRMNQRVDRVKWEMTPQTINAYYHPCLNEIVFPAAILQPPFFNMEADDAVNYGSMGAVIGHEMTHGFDDQGRKFDSEGNLRDWWSGTDGEEYERRVSVMVRQAEQFEVHGVKLKGKLTCGENIADLGGLKLSYRALKKELSSLSTPPPLINGFSPDQRFFLAWSQCWRENIKKERALQLISLDPHGPNQFRANCPLKNIVEFYEVFGIEESDKMYLPSQDRVDIW